MLDYPVTYEVNLTDSIGSLLSRYYNSAQCLSIDNPVCGPFQLSVSITTSTGKSADVQETLLPNDGMYIHYKTNDNILHNYFLFINRK